MLESAPLQVSPAAGFDTLDAVESLLHTEAAPASGEGGASRPTEPWLQPGMPSFVERRASRGQSAPGRERRQFTNSHDDLTPPARELASAVDQYKLAHHRRFISYEEVLAIITQLGYRKG